MAKEKSSLDDRLHWYKDAIIYELHVKAFRDSDGDGIGDFNGLMEKLDYLKDLGITTIWILPFYPSPLKDDGYDIADYFDINPSYGDLRAFRRLVREAHKRDLRIITELVINHTSDQHPWFQRARRAPRGSSERNYYVWTDDPTKYSDVRIIFQDFESSNWSWDPVAGQYYWHRFFSHQPDLNFDHPKVQEEVFRVLDFWCNMGVDGFRLDAIPYLFERDNTNGENLPETHAFLKKLRKHVDTHYPGKVLLAEANMWPEDAASYFGEGDECHMNYHFPVMPRMFMALQMEDRYPITDIFDQTPEIPENCQWAIFLRNHDELTLEMVTDEERDYMYQVYAKDPKAKINLGIRHRLAPLMGNNRRKIELMNVLLLSLRGTPVIYYGDEIGMGDNVYLGDRDGVRTPMQWTAGKNAGFSEAHPQQLYLPLILDPEYQYETLNVELQRKNPSSLLWFMKQLIQVRKNYKAFGRGDMKFLNVENPKVLAFTRSYEDETLLIIVNFSRYAQAAQLDLLEYKGYQPVELMSNNRFPEIRDEGLVTFTLGPHGYFWFRLEKTNPLLADDHPLFELELRDWEDIVKSEILERLARMAMLPFAQKTNWFRGKERQVQQIAINHHLPLPAQDLPAFLLLVEFTYDIGTTDMYQVPIAFLSGHRAAGLLERHPESVICKLRLNGVEGVLFDAFFITEFQTELFRRLAKHRHHVSRNQELSFGSTEDLKLEPTEEELRPRVLPVEDRSTSIGYAEKYFLKMYRHVDRTVNPDVEITRFLTKEIRFPQVPAYYGSIEWRLKNGVITLGMMQELMEYHGDGRSYMLERLNNYHERVSAREVHPALELRGSFESPAPFDQWPEELREFIGTTVAEGMRLLATRLGELHIALASRKDLPDFAPEPFSLHYQRSVFSGLQTLVRAGFQGAAKNLDRFPEPVRGELEALLGRRSYLLSTLKKFYAKKLDPLRIRIHGNFGLKKILFTGRDIAFLDFLGDPTRSYNARRIKRSPLVDVAGMIRSVHYVSHEYTVLKALPPEEKERLQPFLRLWEHSVCSIFIETYLATIRGQVFAPGDEQTLRTMLDTYILTKMLYSFYYEVHKRPEWVVVPLRLIQRVLERP